MIDGTFTAGSCPGGLRNVKEKNRLDQLNFLNGAHTDFNRWQLFFNGMVAMSDPFYGRSDDSTLMHDSGWIRVLRAAAFRFGGRLTIFGDTAFGSSDVVHLECMVKNVYLADDRSFNALMSRIHIHIENAFAGPNVWSEQSVFVSQPFPEDQDGWPQHDSSIHS